MKNLDFSKLSKQEIIKYCNESLDYKNRFGEYFCRKINDDIVYFLTKHANVKKAYIHVISDNDKNDFDYIIDLDKDNYAQSLCIQLIFA